MDNALYRRRRLVNSFNKTMSFLTVAFGLFWLVWILYTLLKLGLGGLSLDVFTQSTPPPGSQGGLANAIYGSLLMTLFGTLIGTPVGILAGVYLAEFGNRGWLAPTTRFINDILLSAPSIVIGLFIYEVYVVSVGHFSGWAGSLALSLLVIPVVVRTTENMLRLVPNSLRDATAVLNTMAKSVNSTTSRRSVANSASKLPLPTPTRTQPTWLVPRRMGWVMSVTWSAMCSTRGATATGTSVMYWPRRWAGRCAKMRPWVSSTMA